MGAYTYVCCDQLVPARENTYAAPACDAESSSWLPFSPMALLLSFGALTANTEPSLLNETQLPNASVVPVLEAFSHACCAHVVPPRVNT